MNDLDSSLRYRPAGIADANAVADLWCRRRPQDPEQARARAHRVIAEAGSDELFLVAEEGGEMVGYGRVSPFSRPDAAPSSMCPTGMYLLGVSVREDKRRRGIGRALTQLRLEWLRERRVGVVHYFANSDNDASIRLHEELGFEPVLRDVTFPGMHDESRPLVLFRLDLSGRALG